MSRNSANTFFTFGFARLLMMPQSNDILSLGLTILSVVDGVHDKGELVTDEAKLPMSVKFLFGGWLSFRILPARQAEQGSSFPRSCNVPCCICSPLTFSCVTFRTWTHLHAKRKCQVKAVGVCALGRLVHW